MAERKRTNAEIDYLNQFLKEGETPLPYEVADNENPENLIELTDEQKAEQELRLKEEKELVDKQKKIDKELEDQKNKILAQEKEKSAVAQPAPIETELDDEKILAYFKSKKGKEITSLDDFLNPKKELTPEEIIAEKEKREDSKLAFGLQQGIFTKKELEQYVTDSKNPKDLVFAAYAKSQKETDPELKDEEIESEFEDKFGLDEEVDSRKYKAGQLLLNNIAAKLINDKHSKILNLESNYAAFENSTTQQKATQAKIESQTPIYKRDVEQIRSEVGIIKIQVGKDEFFETTISEGVVNNVMSKMLEKEEVEKRVNNGWSKENLKQLAQTTGIIQDLPNIMKKYADAQVLKNQAGTRGVSPDTGRNSRKLETSELSDNQKVALSYYTEKLVAN